MEKQELYKKYAPYVKWGAVAIIAVIFMLAYERPFDKQGAQEIVGTLSDCFAIPGIVMSGIGLLTYLGTLGVYDGISYVFSNFALHSIVPGMYKDKHDSFYEYKQAKDQKGRKWLKELFFVGLCPLALSIILLVVYAFL